MRPRGRRYGLSTRRHNQSETKYPCQHRHEAPERNQRDLTELGCFGGVGLLLAHRRDDFCPLLAHSSALLLGVERFV